MKGMDLKVGMTLLLLAVYFVAAGRKYRSGFSTAPFPVKWIKAAGYAMYQKVAWLRGKDKEDIRRRKVFRMLQKRYGSAEAEKEWVQYQATRYAWVLMGVIGICILFWIGRAEDLLGNSTVASLDRPAYGNDSDSYHLQCENSEGEEQDIELELQAVQYSEEEIQELFARYQSILEQKVAGDNPSLDQMERNLDFSPEAGWEAIEVSWTSSAFDVISEDGILNLSNVSEGETDMMLYLTLSYENYQEMYQVPITVIKNEDNYKESLQEYLKRAEEGDRTSGRFTLPGEYDGKELIYREKRDLSVLYGCMVLLAAVVVWKWQEQSGRLKEFQEHREKQMQTDYPDILSELMIYVRAGLPVKNAWCKMVHEYEKQKASGGSIRFALEEMKTVLQEMDQGYGESEAYVRFGKKCEIPQYVKLGNLLHQNSRKGSSVLMELLKREQIEAQEARKRQIRAAGEVAGSKLMMPMIVLFILVMIIIMVPAFMSFSIT